ncbi:dTDP-glucose 4,6-dehydratase [Streptomyces cinereoruber]|uniref:dTDP-glucose 4,6-dehydratase n=1 Tax=Streptomyces cinereoruber TaxID=67260 RepID=A0AAV4KDX9_9ACTN|nr:MULTISPECIES: dTDP-glucose 4,6-dehydratase [Streptomyces]AVH94678.1 dTDP-glucose 4,6-dehydratase [Streptomyces sp. WAC00288]KYG53404.1 dTDP-glucose 4,6-dehydratase [Streptomyces sp. WAC04657]MBB4157665.1 dTDP-glucose 4,6-dehydratase [Streptomyces cinereoruber]MBY8816414.1 dTDP-glucose 4,6-dehydratase [Streptomyces cinereoruber]NIH62182.1 dTDP-glucose 4,6-dehydratase [Streptomyces cinereoruber]
MNILVTGAAGFIGSHFARTLLDGARPGHEGDRVTALDRLTYAGTLNNLPLGHPRLAFVRGDVCDTALLDEVVPGHDAVVHFAAESHVDRSVEGAEAFVRTNVLGTQALLDAALRHGVRTFVQVSTDEVYGSIAEGRWSEEEPLLPNSPYAASKAAADLFARAYARTHGLDVRITRCANNYGPGQHPEKLIPRFVTRLLDGLPVPLYGDGSNLREWLHVDDHCRAVLLVLDRGRPGEVYNVGGGTTLSNREMTARLLDLCGRGWDLVERVEDRKGHDFRYAVDDAKIRRELGYAPRRSFEAELASTVAWYASHRDHWEPAGAAPAHPC